MSILLKLVIVPLLTGLMAVTACARSEPEKQPLLNSVRPNVDPDLVLRTNALLAERADPTRPIATAPRRSGRGVVSSVTLSLNVSPDPEDGTSDARLQFSADFEETSLRSIVDFIFVELLDEPYTIIDPFSDREVNWLIDGEFTRPEILGILSVFLRAYGVSVINRAGVYVISSADLSGASMTPSEIGEYVGIWGVTYLSAAELIPVLRQFVAQPDRLQVIGSANTIIARADRNEIEEISRFIRSADQPGSRELQILVYEPRGLSPRVLVQLLNDLPTAMGIAAVPGQPPVIKATAIEGTEHVLVTVRDQTLNNALGRFLAETDVPVAARHDRFVYYYPLRNQQAATVASAINRMLGTLFPGDRQPTIVDLPETNSLMVTAEPAQYITVRNVIDRIDFTVPSILLEATIVEVALTDELAYGVEWFLRFTSDDFIGDITANFRNLTTAAQTTAGLIYLPENWFVVLDLLQNRTSLSVLSRPRIAVRNGQRATLSSTRDLPIITSESVSELQADRVVRNIERREFGLVLEITPTVSDDGRITLDILLQDQTEGPRETVGDIDQPTFFTRETRTNVSVHNGRTILIAGLFQSERQNQKEGLPGLMDVPVLGRLFSGERKRDRRTELLIFVTPYVVMDREAADDLTGTFSQGISVEEDGELRLSPNDR